MMKRLLSFIMLAIIITQVSGNLVFNAQEIASELNNVSSEVEGSENIIEEGESSEANEQAVPNTAKDTRVYTDFSGIGNQNPSDIGQATYIKPNESTEASLKTIADLSAVDSTKYKSITDLDQNLMDAATAGETVTESIMFKDYTGVSIDDINADLASKTSWSGTCWETNTPNSKIVTTKVQQSDSCDLSVVDYGYYYNIADMTSEPVDLNISIDFLDFFNSPAEGTPGDAKLIVYIDNRGIAFNTSRTNELEFSLEFVKKDGSVVNAPVFYDLADVDAGSGIGVAKDDVYSITTYYQDETNVESGSYGLPTLTDGSLYTDQSVFNYVPFYEFLVDNLNAGTINDNEFKVGSSIRDTDRSIYNSIDSSLNGSGTYTAEDRGWNRLKFFENGDYITVFDSWGPNSNNAGSTDDDKYSNMVTNGKESNVILAVNSSTTMTSNLQDEFFGYSPDERGLGQGWFLKPYSFIGETLINKEMTDASGDGIAQRGEDLTYNLSIKNVSPTEPITNTQVRDSMLESISAGEIDYLTWDGTYTITDATNGTTITGSGNLGDGSFTIDSIPAMTEVLISYTVNLTYIPEGLTIIDNVATNDGTDPEGQCDSTTPTINCDGTEIPIEETGSTIIEKTAVDAGGDGVLSPGEKINYTVVVTNNTEFPAYSIEIKDSMLDNTPTWLSYNADELITTDPTDMVYTGSLATGDLLVDSMQSGDSITITYSLTADNPLPTDLIEVSNVATDNGDDPTTIDPSLCEPVLVNADCAGTVTPVRPDLPIIDPTQAETVIIKSVTDASGDDLVQGGEVLTYTIDVTNPETIDAHDVVVRDSMLEAMPSWLTLTGDVVIDPSDIAYSGSLQTGDLTFNTIEPGQTVTITYSVIASQPLPADITEVANVATDNGQDPQTVDPDTCDGIHIGPITIGSGSDDCAETVTPLDPMEPIIDPTQAETVITKSVTDVSGDDLVQGGEVLTYTIEVTNNNDVDANNVVVRDSMLESMPSWLSLNDITIDPSDIETSGSLSEGDLTFNTIEPGQTVKITYTVTASQPLPTDISEIANVATDNGSNPVDPDTGLPAICPAELTDIDCAETVTPLDPMEPIIDPTQAETVIIKSVTDASGDNLVQGGEVLTYTINVANPETIDAHDVVVRDSMLESMPSWLTLTGDVVIDPSDIAYSGSLQTGDLTFNTIEPGQTVTITYSVTASQPLPADTSEIANVATDNGSNPIDPDTGLPAICPAELTDIDCAETVTPLDPMEPIIDPTQAETVITKSVTDASGDNLVQGGEVLAYTIEVTNPETTDAHDVVVRDSMLESMPSWLTLTGDVMIDPSDIAYSGSLQTGDLTFNTIEAGQTVTISYSVTASQPLPADTSEIANVATDNGSNPIDPDTGLPAICPAELTDIDCAETVTPLDPMESIIDPTQAETVITKSVTDASGDNLVQGGEELTYTIDVTNSETIDAHDVVVRDSMLEAMPSWLTLIGDVMIDPSDIETSGSLSEGDLTFDTIEAGQTVTITYSVTASQPLPADISEIANVVTDNGSNPTDPDTGLPAICPAELIGKDCAETVTPLDPMEPIIDPGEAETVISKSVTDESGDNVVQGGEVLTYTIEVTNPETIDAHDVVVRDSMLEAIPSWLTLTGDVMIDPSDIAYTGNLQTGDLVFDTVQAGQTVTITYSVTVSQPLPADISEIANVVTDNGSNPIDPDTGLPAICPAELTDIDCAETVTPLDPMEPIIDPGEVETVISKSVADESGDNVVQGGEVLTYTIEVTNPETIDAHNVVVRDSMLEAMPTWLTLTGDVLIDPSDIAYTGSLQTGDLAFDIIEAGQSIEITYNVTVAEQLPIDISGIENIATDNGQDPSVIEPETCSIDNEDCSAVVVPLEGDTIIEKLVSDTNGDGIANAGEILTYTLNVTNYTTNDAHNVIVRDSMLEDIPSWLTFNNDIVILPSDLNYSGNLLDNDLTFDIVPANEIVTITYSVTVADQIPDNIATIGNIATDNGQDPVVCQAGSGDCSETITPIEPAKPTVEPTEGDTRIEKTLIDASGDGVVQAGEVLTYTLNVSNPTAYDAYDVAVRDSMLEKTPLWLAFNNDVTINPTDIVSSGSLDAGDLTFDVIPAGEVVSITYSFKVNDSIPSDVKYVENIATDNGDDPVTIDPETCQNNIDCSSTNTKVETHENSLAVTGGKFMLILIDLILILIVSLTLRGKLKV